MSRIRLCGAQVITMTPQRPDAEHVGIFGGGWTIASVNDVIEAPDGKVVGLAGRPPRRRNPGDTS
ncbi:hypothetical protein [Streptomyces litmocidini]|uniref:Uncharacterized protein n=1 Tax=Streptomyces litmocidini TaxID=67318 RepID=A0ABW7TZ34_9ACTN